MADVTYCMSNVKTGQQMHDLNIQSIYIYTVKTVLLMNQTPNLKDVGMYVYIVYISRKQHCYI